ncbi:MAG: hypothetical protein HN736_09925 [Anaerolineae bacterium]|jgi:hypothetical protein|nr:hypothetical protein [Anaerolineae bacterium]MBT4312274.1 hypothetical protein [Anaerolineae bacterium]MBT6060397.1 hypothetical protein [Anaerolineae bacterium]MBT6321991.1 hypothetical protein [Anaerolineae bacterium]MBT6813350.1 hypothetical protein [Anaerolineae bacterium]
MNTDKNPRLSYLSATKPFAPMNKSKNFLWLSFPLFILLILAFLLPISPNDYWWYLRLGSEIAQTHAIPTVETFSQTQADQPMVYHSWLSALILFWVYQLGKFPLTILLRGILLAFTYSLLWKIMRDKGASPQLTSLISFFGILAGSVNWAMRPQLFTYPLFVLTIYILIKWDEGNRDARVLGLIPLISIFWTNLHGSFVLLFLLGGAALIFGRGNKRILFFTLLAALFATFLNPRGFGVWVYVRDSLTVISNQAYSREWMPPTNEGWQMNLFFGWILFYLTVASLMSRSLRPLSVVWMLGFGWLALSGLRYGIWFLFLLSIYTAEMLNDWLQSRPRRGIPKMDYAIAIFILIIPLALLPGIRDAWWADSPSTLSTKTPVGATEWLKSHPDLPAPIWADLAYSSYLVYAFPESPVWIDTRFEVYPPEHWERYKAISAGAWNWESLLDEEGINLLLLSKNEQSQLIPAVGFSKNWDEVYSDEKSVIFKRVERRE